MKDKKLKPKITLDENGKLKKMDFVEVPYEDNDYGNHFLQSVALQLYLEQTSPLEWNYKGWQGYWYQIRRTHPWLIKRTWPEYDMYIDQEEFNEEVEKNRPPLLATSEPQDQTQDELSRKIKRCTEELQYVMDSAKVAFREKLEESKLQSALDSAKVAFRKNEESELPSVLERAKEAFKKKVEESEWYNTCPSIRKPFFWLGSIRELALALSEETGLLDIRINQNREEVYIADVADGLFIKESTGKPITHEQLYNAAKQARDEDNKIKFAPPKKPRSE